MDQHDQRQGGADDWEPSQSKLATSLPQRGGARMHICTSFGVISDGGHPYGPGLEHSVCQAYSKLMLLTTLSSVEDLKP